MELDLAAARSHRDQYQEISQASETALSTLNTTFDEYKASTETQLLHHEVSLDSFYLCTVLTLLVYSQNAKPCKKNWIRGLLNWLRCERSSTRLRSLSRPKEPLG